MQSCLVHCSDPHAASPATWRLPTLTGICLRFCDFGNVFSPLERSVGGGAGHRPKTIIASHQVLHFICQLRLYEDTHRGKEQRRLSERADVK